MKKVIKYLGHPAFTAAEWTTRNPILLPGETGYELLDGEVRRSKIGPGRWNDLPYYNDTFYDESTPPSNPIGDATGNLEGLELLVIIKKMLNPYGVPVLSNLSNNAGGSFAATSVIEIGRSLNGSIQVHYDVSNAANLIPANPIVVTSGGLFSNDGGFPNSGTIAMNLAATITPSSPVVYPISIKPVHLQGDGVTKQTFISFVPRIIWGVSPLTMLNASQFNNISQKLTVLSSSFKRDYDFTAAGYAWLGIPAMLSPGTPIFTDVTDPNAPAGFSMENMGTLLVNNGVGNYNYQLYRSTYYITETFSRLRVA